MVICHILGQSPNWKKNLEACKIFFGSLKVSDSTKASLFSAKKLSEIKKCKDFTQLFEIVNLYLNWDDCYLVAKIIDVCESDKAEMEFKNYKRKIAVYKNLEITSTTFIPPPGFQKFCVTINKSHKVLTSENYKELKTFIFNNLNVHCYVTTGHIKVLYGPLHLEWHVTMQAISHMVKIAREKQDFFRKHAFVLMQIGKEVIISPHTDRHQQIYMDEVKR